MLRHFLFWLSNPSLLSQVIMARSPYLEAKVNRWSEDKKELVIEDCDPVTFNILVDYLYGIEIPKSVIYQESEPLNKLLEMSDKWQMDDLKATVLEKLILESQDLGTLNKLWEMSKMWQMEIPKALAEEVVARGIFKALPFSEFSDRPEIFVQTKLKNGRLVTIKYSCQSCRTTMQSVINKVAAKMEEETHKVRLYSGNASVPGTALAVSFGGCKLIARVL